MSHALVGTAYFTYLSDYYAQDVAEGRRIIGKPPYDKEKGESLWIKGNQYFIKRPV